MSINKALLIALSLSIASCSNDIFITHNGNMPSNERISQIHEGQSKYEVESILGAPSTVVSLDRNTWVYMSADIKKVAFFKPEEVNRDILTIKFDDKDMVNEITRTGMETGNEIEIAEESTETPGHNKGFFEKYFAGSQQYSPLGGMGEGL